MDMLHVLDSLSYEFLNSLLFLHLQHENSSQSDEKKRSTIEKRPELFRQGVCTNENEMVHICVGGSADGFWMQ